jgi:hypothetical protein
MARLVYLLAASHSGSTLTAMLLGAQQGVISVGELKATSLGDPEKYRCSCRASIKDCEFWRKVRREMTVRGIEDFDITDAGTSIFEVRSPYARRILAPLYREAAMEFVRDTLLAASPAWRSHLAKTQERNLALVESLLAITSAKVVVDSSKVALRLKYLLKNPGLDIRVIRVIRDGRAVSLTYMDDWNFADSADASLRGGGSGHRRAPVRRSMAEAANEWKRSNEAADILISTLPRDRWTEVRYEELCKNPDATLARLVGFLGLDAKSIVLDFRSRDQHIIGNGMRLDTTSQITVDERWKGHLSAEDLRVFDVIAGSLNRQYGYT